MQKTFRHSTVVLTCLEKLTSEVVTLRIVSLPIAQCLALGMPNNTRSFSWFKHDVPAPTTCCRTSYTTTAAHGCLSSLKADSGSLRLCLLLFRALASAGATMSMRYKCFTIWRSTTPKWTTSAIAFLTPHKDPYGSSSPLSSQQGQHRRHTPKQILLTMRLSRLPSNLLQPGL